MSPLSTAAGLSAAKLSVVKDMAVMTASNREIAFFIFYLLHFKSAAQTVLYVEISITPTGKKRKRKTQNRRKICQIDPMAAQKKRRIPP